MTETVPIPEGIKPLHIDCPNCGETHIDEGEWRTRPHETHLCLECGFKFKVDFDGVKTCGIPDDEACEYGMTIKTFNGVRLNSKIVEIIDRLLERGSFGHSQAEVIEQIVLAWIRDNSDHPYLND